MAFHDSMYGSDYLLNRLTARLGKGQYSLKHFYDICYAADTGSLEKVRGGGLQKQQRQMLGHQG